jgi:23S rRNA (adenine2503-C2)-methyltransferase
MNLLTVPLQPMVRPKKQTELLATDLVALCRAWGEPAYRARQLARWLYTEQVFDPSAMLDLPLTMRERLELEAVPFSLELVVERSADQGRTSKALFKLRDGGSVESVLMRYPESGRTRARRTVCVSSQVGCAVGCPFCATGLLGLKRHLRAAEIVAQVLFFAREVRKTDGPDARITNVVFMGEGEPLANFRNVWRAVECLNAHEGIALGARRVTISTSGLVPRIRELAEKPLQVGLAISLHAPEDGLRDRLVPVNRKYPVAELIDACRDYALKTRRRISFEYAMMRDVNDSLDQAAQLGRLVSGFLSHVNLIPLNRVDGSPFAPTPRRRIEEFQRIVQDIGVSCTIRATRGDDIDGACGQLRAALESATPGPRHS